MTVISSTSLSAGWLVGVVAATCNLGLRVGIDHWDTVFNAVMRARECLRVRVGW